MKRPIVNAPKDVLHTPARTVTVFDKKLQTLIADMIDTLLATKNPKGVGLAAPQIGEPWRVFIIRPKLQGEIRAFINPVIISTHDEKPATDEPSDRLEGCLSIPKIWGKVKRHQSLVLAYDDEKGAHHEERFEDFPAVIIQHETDHVNGILFTVRVLEQKNKLFQMVRNGTKEEMEEISI